MLCTGTIKLYLSGDKSSQSIYARFLSSSIRFNIFILGEMALENSRPDLPLQDALALRWLCNLLRLPPDVAGASVGSVSAADVVALASARHALLDRVGWDVNARGMYGAPELRVVVSEDVRASIVDALLLLGLGRHRIIFVPTDHRGRMKTESLPELDHLTVVCIHAGTPRTGDFDLAAEICRLARISGAWVHVDGTIGLLALSHRGFDTLTHGFAEADSWTTDANRWLGVPHDSAIVLTRSASDLEAASSASHALLRASGVEVSAALLNVGRDGIVKRIELSRRFARMLAERLSRVGCTIQSEVLFEFVLVSFGSDETSRAVINALQTDCASWCDGVVWKGQLTMRVSVPAWVSTDADMEVALQAIMRAAEMSRWESSPSVLFHTLVGP